MIFLLIGSLMSREKSKLLFERAQKVIPGGVNSPARAFKAVGGNPLFIDYAVGSKITDVDGNEYIDFVNSWGPHIFGHKPPFIIEAVKKALEKGLSFGAPVESEIKLAELIIELVPQVEMVRMVNSGTEATMSAIRLARGYTGKSKIIKFEGCYHGHADSFLVKAGSGALTNQSPTSPGITAGVLNDTLIAKYNDIESVEKIVESHNDIACIIIEPIAGNMGVIKADEEFIFRLREICDENGILLIFDEVMTGFRISPSGACGLYNISPDLVCFGKIIGGGLPVGAYAGKREIMQHISPSGKVYQAGTLSGNPIAMASGIATLEYIKANPNIYDELERKGAILENGFRQVLAEHNLNYFIARVGSMFCLFFTDVQVRNYDDAIKSDTELFSKYFWNMLEQGIYLPPSQFESYFISLAHSDDDLDKTISAFDKTIKNIFNK